MTSDYQYDDLNRLTALYQVTDADGDRRYDAGETLLASFVYTLDDLGNRTAASEVVDGQTYAYTWTYDGLNRLVQEQLDAGDNSLDYTAVYTYDLASNRLTLTQDAGSNGTVDETTTYTYDANDRLLTEVKDVAGTTTGDTNTVYAYGPSNAATQQTGQVVRDGTTPGSGTLQSQTRLSYDVSGRLAQVETDADGDNTYETTTLYAYDDRGLRVSETTNGVTTTYLFDVQNPTGYAQVLEEYVDSVLQRSYTLGMDVLAQTRHDAAARDFLLYDGHGNTRALLTAALAFTQKFAYDAYGVMLSSAQLATAATALTRLLYSGEWTRRDGTQYLRARDYNPAIGRFTSLDSYRGNISDPQSLHKYLYANGNPVMGIDPSGRYTLIEVALTGGIIGGLVAGLADYAATGKVHVTSVLQGVVLGAVLSPLALAFPVLGFGLAAYGAAMSVGLVWNVWTNPRSTNGQLAASLIVFGASIFGVYAAGRNVVSNGWYNPVLENTPTQTGPGLTRISPLSEIFEGVPDDAMVHCSRASVAELAKGVKGSIGTGKSYWFRWGDVKNLTIRQY